jgi:hypothetical protein
MFVGFAALNAPPGPIHTPDTSHIRHARLDQLYLNKPLAFEAAIAFVVIFLSFKNNPRFFVQGISAEGISPR